MEELKTFAKNTRETFKVDKMSGDFLAFGEPFVRKADLVHLYDEDNTEKDNKKFFVEGVNYTFDGNGYRQKITLGAQIK